MSSPKFPPPVLQGWVSGRLEFLTSSFTPNARCGGVGVLVASQARRSPGGAFFQLLHAFRSIIVVRVQQMVRLPHRGGCDRLMSSRRRIGWVALFNRSFRGYDAPQECFVCRR